MKKSIDLVREFHEKFDQPWLAGPDVSDDEVCSLRLALILEELQELAAALGFNLRDETGRPILARFERVPHWTKAGLDALDALTDLQYVLDGTYGSLGYARYKDAALAEVHRSNMSKVWPDGTVRKHENGKVHKPPSYSPADLQAVMWLVDND